jgi:hypothetical protein
MQSVAQSVPERFARAVGWIVGRPLGAEEAAWLTGVPALLLLLPAAIPGQPFWLGFPALVVVAFVARYVRTETQQPEAQRPGSHEPTPANQTRTAPMALVLLALLIAGLALRIGLFGEGWSGVLAVTGAAIDRVLSGLSPWNVPYQESIPPGEPFPYGPTALAWYWPWVALGMDLRWVELAGSCGVVVALAVRRRPIGLAVAALSPVLAMVASDGSNDTSAGIILLVALVLAKRGAVPGGIGLGIAGGFKFHALAWAPGLIMLGGVPALAALTLTSLAIWAPALLFVGPGPILASLQWAEGLHDWAGWSLAGFVQKIVGGTPERWPFEVLRWAGGAVAAGAVLLHAWRRRPAQVTRSVFLAGGLAIFLVVLYAGYWSTHGYLAQIAPILCWELDSLVGAARQPVVRSPGASEPPWPTPPLERP